MLTGTASLFRPRALKTVAAERGRAIPGVPGDFYDTLVLTEDNELTLAIKSLGGLMISPPQCTVVTEVMETWRALWPSDCAGSAVPWRISAATDCARR